MRKSVILAFIVFVLVFTKTSFVFATNTERGVTSELLEQKRLRIEQRMLDKQQKILQRQEQQIQVRERKMATREARLTQVRQQNIKRLYSNMDKKFWAMIGRLEKLIDRINSRVLQIEETENINLTKIKSEISRATTLLDEAKADLQAVDNTIDQTLASNDPKNSFSVIRESLNEIKTKLVEVHRILVKIIGDIKGLRVGQNRAVSGTPSMTVTPTQVLSVTPELTATSTLTVTPTGVPAI